MKMLSYPYSSSALSVENLPSPPPGKRGWPWTVGTKPLPSFRADGSEWPRLSIVTPSYNQDQFIEATIRSVLLQGYPNLDYVIIDGASSDKSVEIILKYEKFLSYWVSEPDQGQTDAINKGLMRTNGLFLAWMNSDDIYTKGAFEKVISSFSENPEAVVVYSNRVLIDKDQNVFGCSVLGEFNPPSTPYIVCSETAFWRRAAMERVGLLNSNLQVCMDVDFFCRLFLEGKFKKIDDYFGCFRCHELSKTGTIGESIGRKELTEISLKMFGAVMPDCERTSKIKALLEFVKHPILVGLPYTKTKFSRYINFLSQS
jgi:glycosyltransferase involved in cell wall biosynthesis